MFIKSSLSEKQEKILNKFENIILQDKLLTQREKLQSWIWLYSSLVENRFNEKELINLFKHVEQNPHFFKDLIFGLTQINNLIQTKDQKMLLNKLKESVEMINALKNLNT